MSLPASRLLRVMNEAPLPFRLGDYISKGFEFMNRNFGMLLAFMLVSTIFSLIAQAIPFVGLGAGLVLAPVFQIGYFQFAYAVTQENRVDFAEFFKGFNKIGPLMVTYALTLLLAVLAVSPGLFLWYQAGFFDWFLQVMADYPMIENLPALEELVDMQLFGFGALAILVGGLGVSSLFSWSIYLVWFYDIAPLEALEASRKLIIRNWFIFLVFLITTFLITGLGLLLCGIGVLYTAPAMVCAQFFAFAGMTRLLEKDGFDQPDDTLDHFIA
jgi:hypothetical protein